MTQKKRKSRARYWIVAGILLLVALASLLPPLINLNRYQHRIANVIGNSLGRKVHMSSVTLRLLPLPGLELSDFVVEEDPAFGAEPTLRASSVTASVRLSSLWRGHLEVGRISLDQPSLNLVRDENGRWNISTVLLQAARIPNAPTAQRHAGGTPRFPYIEASDARVNFKYGPEKKPFSFLNADFAMWLENAGEWRFRLEAQPVRTDLDLGLSDTGLVRLEGSLHRASTLDNMPVQMEAEWTNAPLGQMSRLLLGKDTGWRGNLQVNATIKGNLYNPAFRTRIRIGNMHRQEFTPLDAFNVDATCEGGYHQPSHSLDKLTCLWPIDEGHLLLTAEPQDIEQPRFPLSSFALQVQNVPASFSLAALRLVRNGFAPSAEVTGTMQGHLDYAADSQGLTGNLDIDHFTIRTDAMNGPLSMPALHLASQEVPLVRPHGHKKHQANILAATVPAALHLSATPLPLGRPTPVTVSGDFTARGFSLHLNGDAAMEQLRPLASSFVMLRSTVAALAPQGTANLDLTLHGPWMAAGTTSPAIAEGTLHLQNTSLQLPFLPDPVEIVSAQASFFPERILWNPVSAVFHKIPATLSVTVPIPCPATGCNREFTLNTPALDAATLQSAVMGAGEHGELLQQILARFDQNRTLWPSLTGTVHAGSFTLGTLAVQDANANIHIEGRRIIFTSMDGRSLGGQLRATGLMDASQAAPRYAFDTHLLHANAAETSALWHGFAATGSVNLNTHVEASGYSADDLAHSAKGTFQWDWTQGTLPGGPSQLAHFENWNANGKIGNESLVFTSSDLTHGKAKAGVSGSIGFDRQLHLTIAGSDEETASAKAGGRPSH